MTVSSRDRLARLVRRPDADLAEAALLCCVEADPSLDVDGALLRIDALADGLRTSGFHASDPMADAQALATYLAGRHGFRGDEDTYDDPANALLSEVLNRRRGLPITLSILYVAIARRVAVPAFAIGLPGHVVTGVGGGERPVVIDPFHGGIALDEEALARRVDTATGGRLGFRRAMLRPASTAMVVRRLLNNLTRDYSRAGRSRDALWAVELKLLLPNRVPADHRTRGNLLEQLGRYDEAAAAYEAYLEVVPAAAGDADEARYAAVRNRARMN